MLVLDGRPIRSYTPLTLLRGRVVGPVEPYLTPIAEQISYADGYLVLTRGARRIRVPMAMRPGTALDQARLPLVPLLRALGERVDVDAPRGWIEVTSPAPVVARPAPFDPSAPQVPPTVVFTPAPVATPKTAWDGVPVPRRTPIPANAWSTPAPGG